METPTPGARVDPEEFANYLRTERERREITLAEIAAKTKISLRHLAALERGDIRSWPGGMYRRAIMRAYADSIGVDRAFALEQFTRAFEPDAAEGAGEPSPAPVTPARPARSYLSLALIAVVAVVLLVATAAFWPAGQHATQETGARAKAPAHAIAPVPAVETPDRSATATSGAASDPAADPGSNATDSKLIILSEPSGARVTVDGIGWGATPVTIRYLPFGNKRVRVTKEGYISREQLVRLGPERPAATVQLTLDARD